MNALVAASIASTARCVSINHRQCAVLIVQKSRKRSEKNCCKSAQFIEQQPDTGIQPNSAPRLPNRAAFRVASASSSAALASSFAALFCMKASAALCKSV